MIIEEIKKTLEDIGYKTILRKKENLLIAGLDKGYDEELKIQNLSNIFGITIDSNIMKINYSIGQIYKQEEFSRVSECVKFIKENFPLEK